MRYRIEITSIEVEDFQPVTAWVKGAGEKTEDNVDAYGYVTPPAAEREVERVILLQEAVDLDIKVVIKAVNGL